MKILITKWSFQYWNRMDCGFWSNSVLIFQTSVLAGSRQKIEEGFYFKREQPSNSRFCCVSELFL